MVLNWWSLWTLIAFSLQFTWVLYLFPEKQSQQFIEALTPCEPTLASLPVSMETSAAAGPTLQYLL